MSITLRDPAGKSVQLSDTPFAQGGEAAVYDVPQFPNVVVKHYHKQVLENRANTLRAKIEAMTSDPVLNRFKQHPALAWPRFSVVDERGQWRGYAMRKATGVRMNVLAHAIAYKKHFPGLDRPSLVSYLLNLLTTIQVLHVAKVMIGDYNPANFLCDPGSNKVTLIDCDSWQVTANDKSFRCPVAAADMLAPELLGKELGKIGRTLASEHFSLAILLFKVLMLGRHPYDACGGASPVENIRKGYFPYGLGGGGIPKGPWFNIWSHLPYKLKEQFVRTFKDGVSNPANRTTAAEWIELLTLYRHEMDKGWHSTEISPAMPKPKDYRGTQSISQPLVPEKQ
jgi:DNA-binding helix-hairpin-helix protein with protein kinase domain